MKLTQNIAYQLLFLLVVLLPASSIFGQNTFADNFNNGTNYSNSSGNQIWAFDWEEDGEATNAGGGRIEIINNELDFTNLDNRSISREIDLSAYSRVVLTLDYDATDRGGEILLVQLLNTNTTPDTWETVGTINSNIVGSIGHTLTSDQISVDSEIRLISGSTDGGWNGGDTILIDNVQFETNAFIISEGGTVNTCGGTFYDSGGSLSQYNDDETNLTYTICPDGSGDLVSIEFVTFDVEDLFFGFPTDDLSIYDGSDITGTLLGTFHNGNLPPTTITASSPSGCLTFVFDSDGSVTEDGWEATISCISTAPQLAIGDVIVDESDGTANFTVTHSGTDVPGGFTVEYSTANNTATSAQDYTATGGPPNPTIAFTGNTTTNPTVQISIPITDDNFVEGSETFFVNISNPSNPAVTITDLQGEGTINANDPASLSIDDINVNEGDGTATFTVSLSGNIDSGFTVPYTTVDGSATDPADYTGTGSPTPTISFAGNILNETQQITIPIIDDSDIEGDHTFLVNLGTVSNTLITVSDSVGEATIEDNDAGISIADLTNIGEASGTATFVVTHVGADIPLGFEVSFSSADNTANAPGDYTAVSSPPTLSFSGASGETQNIDVTIINDTDTEGNESFFINLLATNNAAVTITDNQAEGTIIDDEIPFIITDGVTDNTCSGFFVDSGSFGADYSNNEFITYTLCPDTPGSAIVLDFNEFNVENFNDGLVIFQGTTATAATLIGIFDNDNVPRQIVSTDASGCLTFIFVSNGTITDDGWLAEISCASVFLSVNNITVNEADGTATFRVTLNGATSPFTVDYLTEDGTALADSDYTTTSGSLSFAGNNGEFRDVTVPLVNNAFEENDEIFYLTLNNVSNNSVGLIEGIGTITDEVGDLMVDDDVPLELFDEFNGYYDYALTGGSLRTAPDTVDPCDITDASSNTLTTTIPVGSTIDKAYLLWGHTGPSADDVVVFEGQNVTAEVINSSGGGNFYGMVGDVTSIINGLGDPSSEIYNFTGLTVDNRTNCAGTVIIGGWSLMIFYTNPSFPAVGINMYNGFDIEGGGTGSTTTYTLGGFYAIGAAGSKTSVLSWEGDGGNGGSEQIALTVGANNTTLEGDGNNTGGAQNLFNSTIYDNTVVPNINDSTVFGLDLDTFDVSALIGPGETSATTEITTGGDVVILNTVLLKVPSNLISGNIFEDVNYPGGVGRNLTTASGAGINNATVELYRETSPGVFDFEEATTSNSSGVYTFGGMADGTYKIRVVSETVRSTRGGGSSCTACIPVQTYRVDYASGGIFNPQADEIGGANPAGADVGPSTVTIPVTTLPAGAQSVSDVTISGEGVVGLDFGFNFNTIVNTNDNAQGSLEQFIINSNALDETGLDIEANGIFDPAAGEDTSIFMIPTDADPLGRTVDAGYVIADGYFDIDLTANLTEITDDNTKIDGRTQTAYSGDTNTGTIGSGGASVGISATALPSYELPEIQVWSNFGDILQIQASNTVIRNIAVYGGNRRAIIQDSGTNNLITSNLIGVNALGAIGTVGGGSYVDDGIEVVDGTSVIDGNYIASNTDFGVNITGGTSTVIQNNHFTGNGYRGCEYNINIQGGSGVVIQTNLIENADATGINDDIGDITITENTITGSGASTGAPPTCTENSGINLSQNNSSVSNNIINSNVGAGILISGNDNSVTDNSIPNNGAAGIVISGNDNSVVTNTINNNEGAGVALTGGNTSGNTISQNSIYANGGVANPSLGIDINNDGVTINDNTDGDLGPNEGTNFPIFESASIRGTILRVVGWARPGATIEFFLTDVNEGSAMPLDNQIDGPSGTITQDYGEGQVFLVSELEGGPNDNDGTSSAYPIDADGNEDDTNRFDFTITLGTAIPPGSIITATATVANSTSEFGGAFSVGVATVITNRRITIRAKRN